MRSVALAFVLLTGCWQSHQLGDPPSARPDAAPADLCTSTGGHHGTGCCEYHCGDECLLDCIREVCVCSDRSQVFDPARGCVMSSMCGVHGG